MRNDFNKIAAGIVSLISASTSSISAWKPIQDTSLELRNGCAELERSLEQVFHDVDEMRLELVDRLQEVEQAWVRLDSREAAVGQQTDDAEQLRGELQQLTEELAQAREELARVKEDEQQRAEAFAANDAEVRDELVSLRALLESQQLELKATRQERDELQQRVDASQSDSARLDALEAELAEAQRRLAAADATAQAGTSTSVGDCAMTISVEQMSALEQEREALETELELVRNRAAELNETVAEQQREITEQETELGGELQQLRRLVEKQADLFADRADDLQGASASATQSVEKQSQPSDPVVNSVMAQFAKLQKDVAQRRRHRQ